jgi:hypothetical protein
MQKLKWILVTAAIVLGIGAAIFTRPHSIDSKPNRPFYAAAGCSSSKSGETPKPLAEH